MRKFLAFLLAASMLLSCVAAVAEEEPAENEEPIVATAGDPDDYTYNTFLSTWPTTWNPGTWQTSTDSEVLDYIVDGFYELDFNATKDGYEYHDAMAVGDPVDVSADYVGEDWGIEEGETGRAWKITLRDDLKWEDGTPINAETYVESLKRILDPVALNMRADSYWSGSMVLHNAEAYAKQGDGSPQPIALGTFAGIEGTDVDGLVAAHADEPGYINWSYSFGDTYDFETGAWTGEAADETVETPLTLAELYEFYTVGEGKAYATWASEQDMIDWAADELYAVGVRPAVEWDTVGIKATADNEIVFILDQPLTAGFQVKYNLYVYLIKTDLYDACATVTDGVFTTNYGTSVETTASYGPYKLTFFQSDREFIMEKNENWYGYAKAENEGLYQTTRIDYVYVPNNETAMEMFLAGQLDSKGLDVNYIEAYGSSEYAYESVGLSIFGMAFNPDFAALEANQAAAGDNVNKTMLTVKEFRMAMSLGMDRTSFAAATSPSNSAAYALYGDVHIADPETGAYYRDSEPAKETLVAFWGLTDDIGEGKLYPTIDDAIDSITGYNPEMAKEYFNQAYDIAIAEGLMDEDDVVQIIIGIPNAGSAFYNNGYDFIVNNYTDLVTGTKLEGKLQFSRDDSVGNGFGDALRANNVDMLFGVGFSGSAFDPYGFMEVFTVNMGLRYDPSWDITTEMLSIELDGVTYVGNVEDWYYCINGQPRDFAVEGSEETASLALPYAFDEAAALNRTKALAAIENAVLQQYNFIPLINNCSLVLRGQQINYYVEEQVYPLGFGGIKYYTYNYTDGEWDAYVQSQGGILIYN